MNGLNLVLVAAITAEAVVETLKMLWDESRISWSFVIALVIGVAVAFAWPVDIFAAIQFPFSVPWVGRLLTGILFGRGSNYVHDLVSKLSPE